ncbi:hypothetical protein [Reticulibacter mediterranei]|uniref:hypothetical protein n=1 Tax=Reticulibacter mediterranei TaxID=2778369 RepID=UPI001C68E0DC|nr:hypothetical protein [Reticulibacter mediterranei]
MTRTKKRARCLPLLHSEQFFEMRQQFMDLLHGQRCHLICCRAAYPTWPQSEIRSIKDLWGILLFFASLDADLLA